LVASENGTSFLDGNVHILVVDEQWLIEIYGEKCNDRSTSGTEWIVNADAVKGSQMNITTKSQARNIL
jgi:hypothetical protein